jgi:hypothetical protein
MPLLRWMIEVITEPEFWSALPPARQPHARP